MQLQLLARRARLIPLLVQTVDHVLKTALPQFPSAKYARPTLLARPVTQGLLWLQGELAAASPVASQTVIPVSAAASAFTVQAAISLAATRLPVNSTVALKIVYHAEVLALVASALPLTRLDPMDYVS